MENTYFVVLNGNNQPSGPYPRNVLLQMIKNGTINADTLLWDPVSQAYIKIQTSPDFQDVQFGSAQSTPVTPPVQSTSVPTTTHSENTSAGRDVPQSGISAVSIVGFVLALLGTICLFVIQFLPFEIDVDSMRWVTSSSIEHDLNLYMAWYCGLVVGCALAIIGLAMVVGSIVKNRKDSMAIVGLVFCVISICLAGFSLTQLVDKTNSYTTLKLEKEEIKEEVKREKREASKKIESHNEAVNAVTSAIAAALG